MKKRRVDELLIEQHLVEDKQEALSYILAGKVFTTDEIKILTAGEKIAQDIELYIKGKEKKYVSRGGLKLEKAIEYFNIDLANQIVLDIGASTGGFTDVSLKNGAKLVYALDVGTNQLAWELRSHDQVVVMEQTNFRYSQLEDFIHGRPQFATIDVSFISLDLILPPLSHIIEEDGEVVALIKPQFEAAREDIGEGGIVRDTTVYEEVIKNVLDFAATSTFSLLDLTVSPITGTKGNVEFLAHFKKGIHSTSNHEVLIKSVLEDVSKR